jgi:ABC-type transport system substrate-binding protein
MLTTGYQNGEVTVACGDGEAVAVKDYSIVHDDASNTTKYTFVLKNNIKFSDGHPLTMEDVLFNMYVYLDPVYTGSSTMYSTDILGLKDYRTQTQGGTVDADDALTTAAANRAKDRMNELINLYQQVGRTQTAGKYSASYETMLNAIQKHTLSNGYKKAVSANIASVTNEQLKADYEKALSMFKKELERDYAGAKESFTQEPYKSHTQFQDEVFCFMYMEGYVDVEYARDASGKIDSTKIESLTPNYSASVVKDKASAIDFVYNDKIENELNIILTMWATANDLHTEYAAKAKEVILEEKTQGGLTVPNISGIVSLGHTTATPSVTIGSNVYTVAQQHNPDGTPVNANEYDVLEITINGVDPKAIWNFAFAVAPQHYYAEGYTVDIANNKFGVDYGSFDYMRNVIQSTRNIKVPMGAGAYKATDRDNSDNPHEDAFFSNNVVYFKRNDSFMMGQPKIEKIRYRVVSTSNAIAALEEGSVHYISPQYTQYNIDKLNSLAASGIQKLNTDQLGYGYIGINAGKVPDINIRKAIMCAMDTSLALSYYSVGTAENIYWPMSTVSWAYPKDELGNNDRLNDHDYPAVQFNKESAKEKIRYYMEEAGVSAGDSKLTLKFTIAGADLTDHPTYLTFRAAADLLNEMGWNIQVVPDTQALTKLTTGSLAVWAAAWGSTVDPDMYQVYHKNSTATSVLAWGYREILASPALYPEENKILNDLSEVIDEARETEDQEERTDLYREAMGYVLDLAVELPVYQRDVLYAFNANVINSSSMPSEINPYTSPLDRIWEVEFAA